MFTLYPIILAVNELFKQHNTPKNKTLNIIVDLNKK